MDSEWVGRAGILAEAVSFVLIAPEIIGRRRLRRAEQVLEASLEKTQGVLDSLAMTIVYVLLGSALAGLVLALTLWDTGVSRIVLMPIAVLAVLAMGGYLVLFFWLRFALSSGSQYYSRGHAKTHVPGRARPHAGVLSQVLWVPRLLYWAAIVVGYSGLFATLLTGFLSVLLWVFAYAPVYFLLYIPLSLASRLLEGPDRLRALVFGTGLFLLFGGLGAQFFATF